MRENTSDSSDWTAAWAISIVKGLVDGVKSLDGSCEEVERANAHFAAIYPDEDESIDLSDNLVWCFVTNALATCSLIRHGHRPASDAPGELSARIAHLEGGEVAWSEAVRRGDWPIKWPEGHE